MKNLSCSWWANKLTLLLCIFMLPCPRYETGDERWSRVSNTDHKSTRKFGAEVFTLCVRCLMAVSTGTRHTPSQSCSRAWHAWLMTHALRYLVTMIDRPRANLAAGMCCYDKGRASEFWFSDTIFWLANQRVSSFRQLFQLTPNHPSQRKWTVTS